MKTTTLNEQSEPQVRSIGLVLRVRLWFKERELKRAKEELADAQRREARQRRWDIQDEIYRQEIAEEAARVRKAQNH